MHTKVLVRYVYRYICALLFGCYIWNSSFTVHYPTRFFCFCLLSLPLPMGNCKQSETTADWLAAMQILIQGPDWVLSCKYCCTSLFLLTINIICKVTLYFLSVTVITNHNLILLCRMILMVELTLCSCCDIWNLTWGTVCTQSRKLIHWLWKLWNGRRLSPAGSHVGSPLLSCFSQSGGKKLKCEGMATISHKPLSKIYGKEYFEPECRHWS